MEERPLLELLGQLVDERVSWNQRVGQNVKQLREAAGLSQSAFADVVNSSQPYVSMVEAGNGISTETLAEWTTALANTTGGGTNASTEGAQATSAKADAAKARDRSTQRA